MKKTGEKPCPFCGDNMPYLVRRKALGTYGWRMFCGSCGSYGPWDEDPDVASNMWYMRKDISCLNCVHYVRDLNCVCKLESEGECECKCLWEDKAKYKKD